MSRRVRQSEDAAMERGRIATAASYRLRTTLGELVVAAFDVVGDRAAGVAQLLSSPQLTSRVGRARIVLTQ